MSVCVFSDAPPAVLRRYSVLPRRGALPRYTSGMLGVTRPPAVAAPGYVASATTLDREIHTRRDPVPTCPSVMSADDAAQSLASRVTPTSPALVRLTS